MEDFGGRLLFSGFMGVEAGMWGESGQVISSLQNSNMELDFPIVQRLFTQAVASQRAALPSRCPAAACSAAERRTRLVCED